jgi:putative oxidoreductase
MSGDGHRATKDAPDGTLLASWGGMWLMRTSDDRAAFVARVTLGFVMFPHGAQKALGWFGGEGFRATVDGMGEQGIPTALAAAVVAGELLASLTLVVGFFGRLAAAGIAAIMLGAVFLVHAQHGLFMNWTGAQAGEGFEYHLLALALALVVMIKGSGALSIDRVLTAEPTFEPAHVGLTAPDVDGSPSRPPEVSIRH